ncbi:MAG TPA: YdcH family protein [Candidatus Polarisedimenticolia bacterium]|nr:YdcH family protein [Candidatus Polarisedimenticolia bacterium]
MPMSVDAVRERLVRENEEYRRLFEKHQSFEERLQSLNARLFLSDEEKVEAITLKKHKLALKDRMAQIAKEFAQDDRAGH